MMKVLRHTALALALALGLTVGTFTAAWGAAPKVGEEVSPRYGCLSADGAREMAKRWAKGGDKAAQEYADDPDSPCASFREGVKLNAEAVEEYEGYYIVEVTALTPAGIIKVYAVLPK